VSAQPNPSYKEEDEYKPFRKQGLGYVYEPEGLGLRLSVDYLHDRGDDLTGEIVAESTLPGVAQHLLRTRMNLLVDARLTDLRKRLTELVPPLEEAAISRVVRSFVEAVIRAHRSGGPFFKASDIPDEAVLPELVEQLLPDQCRTLLYGNSGVGKGWIAVLASVCVASGVDFCGLKVRQKSVCYLDWEDRAVIWKQRVRAVCNGLGIPIPDGLYYRRMSGPLHGQVNRVARFGSEARIGLFIGDSVEMATGSLGDRGTYEDSAKRLFEATDAIGDQAWLLIDHISAAASANTKTLNKPINSIMKRAWVRRMWEIRNDQKPGAPTSNVGLYHAKTNHSRFYDPIGIRIDFSEPGSVHFEREDVRQSEVLSELIPLAERLLHAIGKEPKRVVDLAELLDEPENKLRVVLNRHKDRRFVHLADGKWAALDQKWTPRIVPGGAAPGGNETDDVDF
jgi:hypothetical protein